MSIKLKGSSDGSVSFDAPADTSPSGSDITLTLPTSAGSANQFLKNSGTAGTLEYSSLVEDSSGNLGLGGITSPTWASDGGIHLGDDYGIGFGDGGSGRPDFQLITAGDGRLDLRCGFGADDADISIDSTGRLLVGTTSDTTAPLVVKGAAGSGSDGVNIISGSTTVNSQAAIYFSPSTTGSNSTGSAIKATRISGDGSDLRFETCTALGNASVERMTILKHGSLRVSTARTDSDYAQDTTNYWHVFHHHQNSQVAAILEHSGNSDPSGLVIDFSDAAPNNNSSYYLKCQDSSADTRLYIWSDGDVDNHDNSYSGMSDLKLKQDIVDAGSQWDDIKDLRVRKFRFKSDVAAYGDEAKTLIGVVAQETELVSPGLVKESPDRDREGNDLGTTTKSVRYSVLYMKAVKALQEAQTRIETLESQHADLLARVTALEAA